MSEPQEKKSFGQKVGAFGASLKRRARGVSDSAKNRLAFEGEIKSALKTLNNIMYPDITLNKREAGIPAKILAKAKGLVFMTEMKAGFLFSGKGGTGLVVKKLADGKWSGPSLFGFGGVGAGLMVGFSRTDTILLLNTEKAVKVFMGKGQVKLGADLEVTAGPVGRHAGAAGNVGKRGIAPSYAYSHSKGLYAGLSIDGTVIVCRNKDNAKFYNGPVTSEDILEGRVDVPQSMVLEDLYSLLKNIEKEVKRKKTMDNIKGALPSISVEMPGGAKMGVAKKMVP